MNFSRGCSEEIEAFAECCLLRLFLRRPHSNRGTCRTEWLAIASGWMESRLRRRVLRQRRETRWNHSPCRGKHVFAGKAACRSLGSALVFAVSALSPGLPAALPVAISNHTRVSEGNVHRTLTNRALRQSIAGTGYIAPGTRYILGVGRWLRERFRITNRPRPGRRHSAVDPARALMKQAENLFAAESGITSIR
jgi:hypothetical protein